MNFKGLITHLLTAVFVLTASSELLAQEKDSNDLKRFKVIVERTENGIKMQSIEGSAWTDLSFSTKNDKPQPIDEFGMTDLKNVSSNKDSDLADFLFTITKTKNGFSLTGIEGTVWTELSFSLAENEKLAIDQFGMTELN